MAKTTHRSKNDSALRKASAELYGRYNFKVSHGFFYRAGQQHSWLWRYEPTNKAKVSCLTILDLYPVGGANPFMVDGLSVWSNLYMESNMHYTDDARLEFVDEAKILLKALQPLLPDLS
jgi:hypothetical protein